MTNQPNSASNTSTIVLGGGCFWCLEAAYQEIIGVEMSASGYAGGHVENPTYEQVSAGRTGHAEVVQLTFQPKVITFNELLDIFWIIHDPTTPGRQGNDVGPQYRSIILYINDEQKQQAEASKAAVAKLWPNPVMTEIAPLEHFWPAEAYHQNYFRLHPEAAYCQVVINPKLAKLRAKFASRLKPEA